MTSAFVVLFEIQNAAVSVRSGSSTNIEMLLEIRRDAAADLSDINMCALNVLCAEKLPARCNTPWSQQVSMNKSAADDAQMHTACRHAHTYFIRGNVAGLRNLTARVAAASRQQSSKKTIKQQSTNSLAHEHTVKLQPSASPPPTAPSPPPLDLNSRL